MRVFFILAFATLGFSSSASAQDIGGYGAWGSSYVNLGIHGAMMDAATQSAQGDEPSDDAAEEQAKADPKALTYKPDKARRKQNLAGFVKKTRKVDPAGADILEQVFASDNVIEQIAAGIAVYDLKIDNVADAYTLYWVSAWQAVNADYRDISRELAQNVKAQAEEAMLNSPEFLGADDAVKQELAEAYLIQSVQIGQMQELAKTDKALESRLAAAVKTGAEKSGFAISKLTLTDEGFVKRD